MASRPPDDLAKQFAADTFTLTAHELAGKYGIAESTVRDWRLFCKCYLELAVGYGAPAMTFINKKDDPGPVDDEELWERWFSTSLSCLHLGRSVLASTGWYIAGENTWYNVGENC